MQDFTEDEVKVPEELRYSEEHIWMRETDFELIQCGITGYMYEKTGEIISLDFIKNIMNMEVSAGEKILTLDSLKDSLTLQSPISGTITAVNELCIDSPELIFDDPYGEGWLFIISPKSRFEYEHQLHPDEYEYIIIREKEHSY